MLLNAERKNSFFLTQAYTSISHSEVTYPLANKSCLLPDDVDAFITSGATGVTECDNILGAASVPSDS